jgi:hypothetical protein
MSVPETLSALVGATIDVREKIDRQATRSIAFPSS